MKKLILSIFCFLLTKNVFDIFVKKISSVLALSHSHKYCTDHGSINCCQLNWFALTIIVCTRRNNLLLLRILFMQKRRRASFLLRYIAGQLHQCHSFLVCSPVFFPSKKKHIFFCWASTHSMYSPRALSFNNRLVITTPSIFVYKAHMPHAYQNLSFTLFHQ
jgi:hypothetical protein